VGIVAGRRVGNAVVRNRARRRIREALRLRYPAIAPGHDLVLVARPASATASWPEIERGVDVLLTRAGLWRAGGGSLDREQAAAR
jgi:ribonuclease P protein component